MAKNWKNSTLAERLDYVLKEMGWSEAELARQVGAAQQSTVQHWLTGRNKRMQSRFAWPLQDNYRWNARWLLDGYGDPRVPEPDPEKEQIIEELRVLPTDRLKAIRSAIGP